MFMSRMFVFFSNVDKVLLLCVAPFYEHFFLAFISCYLMTYKSYINSFPNCLRCHYYKHELAYS